MGKNGIEAMLGHMKARVKLYAHWKLLKGWFTLKILRRYESVVSGAYFSMQRDEGHAGEVNWAVLAWILSVCRRAYNLKNHGRVMTHYWNSSMWVFLNKEFHKSPPRERVTCYLSISLTNTTEITKAHISITIYLLPFRTF